MILSFWLSLVCLFRHIINSSIKTKKNCFVSQKTMVNPFWVICVNSWIHSHIADLTSSSTDCAVHCVRCSKLCNATPGAECNAISAVQQIVRCDNTRVFCILRDSTVSDVNCRKPQESTWNGLCGAISAVQQMVRCGKKPPQIGENAKMSQFLKVALTLLKRKKIPKFLNF